MGAAYTSATRPWRGCAAVRMPTWSRAWSPRWSGRGGTGPVIDLMIVLSEQLTPACWPGPASSWRTSNARSCSARPCCSRTCAPVGGLASGDWLEVVPLPGRVRRGRPVPTGRSLSLFNPCRRTPGRRSRRGRPRWSTCGTVDLDPRRGATDTTRSAASWRPGPVPPRGSRAAAAGAAALRGALRLPRHPRGDLGVPAVASPVAEALHPLLVEATITGRRGDSGGRRGALTLLQTGRHVPDVAGWLESPDEDLSRSPSVALGQAGVPPPDKALEAGLAGHEMQVRQVLYAAGMASSPRAHGDQHRPGPVTPRFEPRRLGEGGRVTDVGRSGAQPLARRCDPLVGGGERDPDVPSAGGDQDARGRRTRRPVSQQSSSRVAQR